MTMLQNNRVQNAGGKGSHRQFLFNSSSQRQLVLKIILFLVVILSAVGVKAIEVDTAWMRQTLGGGILSISFHPSSQFFAVGNEGNYVGIWDVNTATETKKHEGYASNYVYFSKTGKYLVQANNNGFRIYDFMKDSLILSKDGYPDFSYLATSMSYDERFFVAGNRLGLTIWEVATGNKVFETDSIIRNDLRFHGSISTIEFSPDGTHLVFSTFHGDTLRNEFLRFINLSDYTIDYKCPIGMNYKFKYSNTGTKIAFASPDSGEAIKIMDVNTKQIISTIPGISEGVGKIVFSSDDKYLVFTYSEEIITWNIILNKLNKSYYTEPSGYLFSPNCDISINQKYIAGNSGSYLYLFNFNGDANIIENNVISATLVYPNPSDKDKLSLTFNLIKSEQTEINIFSIEGRIVQEIENKYLFEGSHSYSVNISDLSNGTYFIKITSGNNDFSKSIIISR